MALGEIIKRHKEEKKFENQNPNPEKIAEKEEGSDKEDGKEILENSSEVKEAENFKEQKDQSSKELAKDSSDNDVAKSKAKTTNNIKVDDKTSALSPQPSTFNLKLLTLIPVVIILLLISSFLGLYLITNTILKDRALPFLRVEDEIVFFDSKEELENKLEKYIEEKEEESIVLTIDGKESEVLLKDLELEPNTDELINYGKGSIFEFTKAYYELIRGERFHDEVIVSADRVISQFPYKIGEENAAKIDDNEILNCTNNTFNIEINKTKLSEYVASKALYNSSIELDSFDYISNEEDRDLFANCKYYLSTLPKMDLALNSLSESEEVTAESIFSLKKEDNRLRWEIKNQEKLNAVLSEYKSRTDKALSQGYYEVVNNQAYLLSTYSNGKYLNLENTLENIVKWLRSPENESPLAYDEEKAEIEKLGIPIKDFSQIVGEGYSRMHMVWDNTIGQSYNARVGFNEMNNVVVGSGAEFSFFNTLSPQGAGNEFTKNGELIAMGICTPVTTLFRSVLDAGLEVTDRENHAEYVTKYMYNPKNGDPSGLDLVDATFLAIPGSIIDFKFKNDFGSDVLIKSYIWYDEFGYQQHKVELRTSAVEKRRQVEFSNWTVWDYVNRNKFNSQFSRTVKVDNQILRQDSFFSDYQWGYL